VAGAPVCRVGATFDQACGLEVIEEVRHDRAVDAEVLREGDLAADGSLGGGREHLVAARTAGQVGDCGMCGGDVSPKDRPKPPSQVVCQSVATAADRHCCFSVLGDIVHHLIVPVMRKKVFYDDVL
jgi:hypothetical protein